VASAHEADLAELVINSRRVPQSGLHNPIKNPERYLLLGQVCFSIAAELRRKEIASYFAMLI